VQQAVTICRNVGLSAIESSIITHIYKDAKGKWAYSASVSPHDDHCICQSGFADKTLIAKHRTCLKPSNMRFSSIHYLHSMRGFITGNAYGR
jgi:hypothetical protein